MGHNSKNEPSYPLIPVSIDLYRNDVNVNFRPIAQGNTETPAREEIKTFSERSRKRLAFTASNTDVDFLSMITLTYPSVYPGDGKTVKKQLNTMLTRLRQRYASLDYLWFLEFQKRGAPHVHILMSCRSDRKSRLWLSRAWYDIVGSGDIKHLKAGTQFVDVRKPDGAKRYAVKYAMKMEQKTVPDDFTNVGRFWGNSKNVKPRPLVESVPITDTHQYKRLLRNWSQQQALDQPLKTLYNASVVVAQQLILEALNDNTP